MAVSGVRSSCETLATNSVRTCSSRRSSVTSCRTMTTPTSSTARRSGTAFTCTRRSTELAMRDAALARRPALAKHLVQLRVADDLEEGFSLAARRVEAEHGPRPLVHQEDDVAAVDGNDAFDHAVEDRGGLRLLVPEIVDLLPEPRRQAVERPPERPDLVGGADRSADREVALTHLAGDRLHLHDRLGHTPRHEEPDPERDGERDDAPGEHDAVDLRVRRGHSRQRQGHPDDTDRAAAVDDGQRHVEE